MLYLGLCAVNRTKEEPLSESLEKKEHFINEAISENIIDYFLLTDISKEKSDAHNESASKIFYSTAYLAIIFYIPDKDVFSHNPDYCLFSRPPPSFS